MKKVCILCGSEQINNLSDKELKFIRNNDIIFVNKTAQYWDSLFNNTLNKRHIIATDESYKNKDGEKVDKAEFHRIVAMKKQAETIAKFLKKGELLIVEGSLKTRSYSVGREKRYTTEIHLNRFEFVPSSKRDNHGSQKPSEQSQQPNLSPDDDLPF